MLHPGDLLSDRYRLDAAIASGGMGEVWRATDTVLGRVVAVKVLHANLFADPGFSSRFRAEARIMAALRHPNIVDVYDYGESPTSGGGTVVYLVMAYVDGEPLAKRIADTGRLSAEQTLAVVAQAAEALHVAHSNGIVHRDVKPANLLVRPDGTVVLADFGVARSAAMTAVTAANSVPGTALYMAPEQVSGQPVSAATDIYALGAVAYHCLVGEPPFTGEAPLQVALHHLYDEPPPLPDDVPQPARNLVDRALAKDPADRYPTAIAFAAAARAGLTGDGDDASALPMTGTLPTSAPEPAARAVATAAVPAVPAGPAAAAGPATAFDLPVAPASRGSGWSSRRRAALAGLAALLLATVGLIAVLGFTRNSGAPPPADPHTPSSAPAATSPSRPNTGRTNPPARSTGSAAAPTTAPGSPATTPATSPAPPRTTQPPPSQPGPVVSVTAGVSAAQATTTP